MAKRRPGQTPTDAHFVIESVAAELGSGTDKNGLAVTDVLRLELAGRWTTGQAETISCIVDLAGAAEVAALIDRVTAKRVEATSPPTV